MLRFVDGFDHYSTLDILKKWTTSPPQASMLVGKEYGRSAGGSGWTKTGGNVPLAKILDAQPTMIYGFAYRSSAVNSRLIHNARSSDAVEQVSVRTDASSRLIFNRGSTVLGTAAGALAIDTWYYIEYKVTIHNTTGVFEVRVDGVPVIGPTSGANTRTHASENSATSFAISSTNSGGDTYDDLYACDATGGVNDTFLGPVRILPLRPMGVGNSSQWIPAAYADNFVNVADDGFDGDISFNHDATPGHIDLYEYSDVPPGTIAGIQVNSMIRKDAGAARTVRPKIRIGSTNYNGNTVSVPGSYIDSMQCWDTSPASAAAWTTAEVNAAQFGIELVS